MASLFQRVRQAWANYIGKLAKANRESFGSGRMDCCGLKGASEKKTKG